MTAPIFEHLQHQHAECAEAERATPLPIYMQIAHDTRRQRAHAHYNAPSQPQPPAPGSTSMAAELAKVHAALTTGLHDTLDETRAVGSKVEDLISHLPELAAIADKLATDPLAQLVFTEVIPDVIRPIAAKFLTELVASYPATPEPEPAAEPAPPAEPPADAAEIPADEPPATA